MKVGNPIEDKQLETWGYGFPLVLILQDRSDPIETKKLLNSLHISVLSVIMTIFL